MDAAPLSEDAFWSIVSNCTLHWKMWEDECVVFNSGSGQTHVLDPIAAILIREINEGRIGSEALMCRVAKLLDVDLTTDVRTTFQATLWYLDELSLIERSA